MGFGGISHWIIILIIVLVVFGAGRIGNVMGELGKGIRSFKEGLNEGDDKSSPRQPAPPPPAQIPQQPIDSTATRPYDPAPPPPPPSRESDGPQG